MKKHVLKRIYALFIMTFAFTVNVKSQMDTTIDSLIIQSMSRHHIPGLSAVIIKNGKVAWAKGYGYADIKRSIPFSPNTISAEIANTSNTVTATALLQLWEQGRFQLDDPINNYLPFTIKNPYYPTIPITFRMLLNNTSSMSENGNVFIYNFDFKNTATQSLGSYIYDILNPAGALYVDSLYFNNYPPGTHWKYSNFGYALIGFLVEHISGVPFDKYCNIHIFQPLCMNHTGWFFSDVDSNIVSRPYFYNDEISGNGDYGLYEYPDYPDGQLKTSVIEYAKFMLMHMNDGVLNGVRILKSTTVKTMRTNPVLSDPATGRTDGLGIFNNPDYCGTNYWNHGGANLGINSRMYFDLTTSTGIIAFMNNDETYSVKTCDNDDLINLLTSFAATIPTTDKPDLNCTYIPTPCEHGTTFWKNNPDKWALNSVPMRLGTQHFYNKQQLLMLLDKPVSGNASTVLAKQLIAAKLNAAQGSELSPIISTINAANDLIGTRMLAVQPKISFYSPQGIQMLVLAAQLNLYNYRFLNSENCSGNGNREISEMEEIDIEAIENNKITVSPNPFSGVTTVSFTLSQAQVVSLKVFDVSGRLIKVLTENAFEEGEHLIEWNAEEVNAGIYFLQIWSGEFSKMEKLIVTK